MEMQGIQHCLIGDSEKDHLIIGSATFLPVFLAGAILSMRNQFK